MSKKLQHLVEQPSLWRDINLTWLEYPIQLTKGLHILKTNAGNHTKSVCLGSLVSNNILKFLAESCPNLESIALSVKHLEVDVDLSLLSRNLREINLKLSNQVFEVKGFSFRLIYLDRGFVIDNFVQEPFRDLRCLSLEYARITHRLASQLSLSKHLNSLNLQECVFTGSEEVDILMKDLPKLKSINLDNCCFRSTQDLEAVLLSIAVNVKKLSAFSISDPTTVWLEDLIPALDLKFDNFLEALESSDSLLSLYLTRIQGIIPSVFSNFLLQHPTLERLHLAECYEVNDDFVRAISEHLRKLKELNLSGCDMVTCDGLKTLAHHPTLQKLDVSKIVRNKDTILSIISTLPNIHHLVLSSDCRDSLDEIKQVKPYLVVSFRPWAWRIM